MSFSISNASNAPKIDITKLLADCKPTETEKKSDGTVVLTCADLREIRQAPQGEIEIFDPINNTYEYRDPQDGSLIKIVAQDWVATPQADGRMKYTYKGGEISYVDKENSRTEKYSADGMTKTTIDAKNCSVLQETTKADGIKIVKYADQGTSYITIETPLLGKTIKEKYYSDGRVEMEGIGGKTNVAQLDLKDGKREGNKTVFPYGDGRSLLVSAKGNRSLRLADGSVEEFLKPEQFNLKNPKYLEKIKKDVLTNPVFK